MIGNLVKKSKKKPYTFSVPASEKTDEIKIRLPESDVGRISKDRTCFEFQLKMNEKEKEKFDRTCSLISKEDKIPLYTFRCYRCKKLFLMSEFCGLVITKKGNKLDSPPICKICS